MPLTGLEAATAEALIGLDTLWGGDVMNPSGTGRFIADSWFSDEPLPAAYTRPEAARLREVGGASTKPEAVAALDAYLAAVDVRAAVAFVRDEAGRGRGAAGALPRGARHLLRRDARPGARGARDAVSPSRTNAACARSWAARDRRRTLARSGSGVRELLAAAGFPSSDGPGLLAAVDAWRAARIVPQADIPALSARLVAELDALTARNVMPHLPAELARVPRANVTFLPIENAWFSGSMNYLGRARKPDGSPEYEATYELNASLEISVPEFAQLVSHEVVPGHVTTFAFLQDLFVRGILGFEASVLTMNTRPAALFEGIANNAHPDGSRGPRRPRSCPTATWRRGSSSRSSRTTRRTSRRGSRGTSGGRRTRSPGSSETTYLVSDERADKLSGAWGRHPLLGRMYLPAYRAGTEKVAGCSAGRTRRRRSFRRSSAAGRRRRDDRCRGCWRDRRHRPAFRARRRSASRPPSRRTRRARPAPRRPRRTHSRPSAVGRRPSPAPRAGSPRVRRLPSPRCARGHPPRGAQRPGARAREDAFLLRLEILSLNALHEHRRPDGPVRTAHDLLSRGRTGWDWPTGTGSVVPVEGAREADAVIAREPDRARLPRPRCSTRGSPTTVRPWARRRRFP